MSSIKLIAVDLDNTLLDDKTVLLPHSAAALQRAAQQGVQVIIATTRGYDFARILSQLLGFNFPIIASNGAEISAATFGPMLANHTILQHIAHEIAARADQENWKFSIATGAIGCRHLVPPQEAGLLIPSRRLVAKNVDAVTAGVTRMLIHSEPAAEYFTELCKTEYDAYCRTETYYKPDGRFHSFGIFPKLADKGTALRLVLDEVGISAENALAIGDNFNDVPMFKVAGTSVAMGNAVDAVKQQATHVAPPFQQDGVAWAVNKLIF